MWSNALNSDWIKNIVEFGTELIKIVDDVGLFNVALVGLGTYLSTKYMQMDFAHPIKSFKQIFGKPAVTSVQDMQSNLEKLQQTYDEAFAKWKADPTQETRQGLINAKSNLQEYKQELDDTIQTTSELEDAQKHLADAQNNLDNYKGNDPKKLYKYRDAVDRARQKVDALNESQQRTTKTGSSGWQKLGVKVDGFTQKVQSAVASMLVMYAITKIMSLIGDLWDKANETAEEAKESFETLSSELSKTKSELASLESQLEDIQSQIEDINDNTPLTFTDREELSRLEAQSAELQRQIDLLNTIKEQQAIGVNSSAINAANKYGQTGVTTGKTAGENVGDKALGGAGIGAGIGVATGVGGSILSAVGAGTALGSWAGPIGMLLGAAIGAIAGAAIGAVVGGIQSASEKTVGDSLDDMKSEYERLKSEYETARANYQANASDKNKKKFEKAQEAFNTYQSNMASYMTEMDSYYSQIKQNWDQATTAQKQEYIEWQDTMDTWAIQSSGQNAKSNAIARIFGDEAQGDIAKARDEINRLKENLAEAKKQGEGVDEALAALEAFELNLSDAETQRLRQMGIYLIDAENYLKDVVKTETEFVNLPLEDVAKDINKIATGLGALKDAFDEILDKGYLTATTLKSLKESLSETLKTDISSIADNDVLNAWKEYQEIMLSGTATTEQMTVATEELANSILDYALKQNELTPETKWTYITQLRDLGIDNADEYVEDLLQRNMVQDIETSLQDEYWNLREHYGKHVRGGKSFDDLTDEEKAEYAKTYNIPLVKTGIDEDAIAKIRERYDVEEKAIDKIVEKLQEREKLEYEIANITDQQGKYEDVKTGYAKLKQDYETALAAYQNAKPTKKYKYVKDIGTKNYDAVGNVESYTYNGKKYLYGSEQVLVEDNSQVQAAWRKFEAAKTAYENFLSQYSEYFDENGKLKTGIADDLQEQYDSLTNDLDIANKTIEETLTVDVKLQLGLVDEDELVDNIQNVFDTLKNAVTEFNENGYLTVDTVQGLLSDEIDSKYLTLLQDENGQLQLNEQSLLQLAKARMMDLGIKKATNLIDTMENALNDDKIEKAKELTTVTYGLTESTWDLVESEAARVATLMADKGMTANEIASFTQQIQAIINLTDNAVNNLPNTLSASGNTVKQEAESEWERLNSYYENQLALIANERDLIEAEIDKAEARDGKASVQYYEDLIRTSTEEKTLLEEQYAAMKRYLDANKDTIDQDTWTEYNNSLNKIAVSIKECETNTIQWQKALREIDIHYFEQATDEISRLGQELEFVNSLLEDEDVADENGNWSSAALTRMAMYMNQIEASAADTQRYQDEIAKLNQQYADGELSEEQYQDRLSTLTDGLYDSINAQEDARDSIVELNEARIDAIKEGIEKEIEAYEDYIDVVKDSLDAERDLYDFKKKVKDQTKDINQLERRIASLSGATDASSVAERRKLEAQLMEAKEGLNDTYYDHSRDAQQNALDSEAESYREAQEKRIEALEKTLEDTETLIYNSMMDVLFNADVVYNELAGEDGIAAKYGIQLSKQLTDPWDEASKKATAWKNELQTKMTSGEYAALIGEGGAITVFANGVGSKLSGSWNTAKTAAEKYSDFLTGKELGNKFSSTITGFGNQIQTIIDKWGDVKDAADEAYQSQLRVQNVGGNPNTGGGSGSGSGGAEGTSQSTSVPPAKQVDNRILSKYKLTSDQVLALGYGPISLSKFEELLRTYQIKYSAAYAKKQVANMGILERSLKKVINGNYVSGPMAIGQYAKGTMGTTSDQWMLTDELGDELVMYATPEGTLSYARVGTTVVPADITQNLVEWGKLNPNMMNMPSATPNINMINSAVNKPEFNFNVDKFLHCDNVTQDSLPELKQFVKTEMNNLVKNMNYAIKGKGGR